MRKKDNKNYEIKPKKHFIKVKYILIVITIAIIFSAIKLGLFIGNWQTIAKDMINNTPSIVYDINGEKITEIKSSKPSKNIKYENVPSNLINAYIAIEDQRFYKHHGVDFPRTAAAIFSYVKNLGSASFGGSSITQQLVKNITGDNSSKISRKVNEWIKALALEQVLTKEEILESYLNIIYVSPGIYGVELGSEYYFNKPVNELSLAECAFLAGINNSPNSYNPFGEKDTNEKITKRVKAVLSKMIELNYITQEEFDTAISDIDKGLKFKKGKIEIDKNDNIYDYHTDALLNELIEDISNKKHMSTQFATNYIETSGLNIYSTQDITIQKTIQDEFDKSKYKLKSKKDSTVTSQAAMVIMNQNNGQVLGCVGGIGKKTVARGFNRATQAYRQTGSAGKPIAVLIPAIDKKILTPSSMYLDEQTTFDDGTEEGYSPINYNKYKGNITVRSAVESSQNIPFVRIMEELTPKTSIQYMKNMGITSLTKEDENLNLALGGLSKGITPLEMAAAYSTIANDGVYIEPTFYNRIENNLGKTILKTKQVKKKVFSKEVAFVVKELLTQPVKGTYGTAQYCNIDGIDVAAKTGTTNNDYDRWLCGFTPYYTAVTWFGFDSSETINFNHKNPSGQIWSSVMKSIHKNKNSKLFNLPKDIECAQICPETGLLATTSCKNSYGEYYLLGTAPQDSCTKHTSGTVITPIEKTETTKPNNPEEIDESYNPVQEESVPEQPEVQEPTTPIQTDPVNNDISSNTTADNTQVKIEDPVVEDDNFISDDDEFEQ